MAWNALSWLTGYRDPQIWNPLNPIGTETNVSMGNATPLQDQILPGQGVNALSRYVDPATGQLTYLGQQEAANPLMNFDTGGIGATRGVMTAPKALDEVRKAWDALGVDHHVSENGNTITLSKIVVPEGVRGTGIGTQAMQHLMDYADQTGQQIALTPDKAFGASSVSRLRDFYKSLGFVPNKGRSRDFSTKESMIRSPADPAGDGE